MSIETLEIIYNLLKRETRSLEKAYKEAHTDYMDALENDKPEDVVDALKSTERAAYVAAKKAREALAEFMEKKW